METIEDIKIREILEIEEPLQEKKKKNKPQFGINQVPTYGILLCPYPSSLLNFFLSYIFLDATTCDLNLGVLTCLATGFDPKILFHDSS
jgi:hypothetical protein